MMLELVVQRMCVLGGTMPATSDAANYASASAWANAAQCIGFALPRCDRRPRLGGHSAGGPLSILTQAVCSRFPSLSEFAQKWQHMLPSWDCSPAMLSKRDKVCALQHAPHTAAAGTDTPGQPRPRQSSPCAI